MKKRLCSLCLMLVMLWGWAVPVMAADAVSGECGENLVWTLEGTTLTISGSGAMADYSYSEPAPWKDYASSIVHLVVEDGVTTLGSYSMKQCEKLLDVSLPESLTAIGESAFYYCDALGEVTLPQSLTELGSGVFENCGMLTRVDIPQGLTQIPDRAFSGCSLLEQVELQEGVTAIGDSAFYDCGSLTTMTIPVTVTELGNAPFGNCSGLQEILVEEGNADFVVENGALCNADKTLLIQVVSSAEELTMPETLTRIGGYALSGCENLSAIVIPEGVTSIGDCAMFNCINAEYMVIPASVENMGYAALRNNGYLGFSETTTDIYFGGDEAQWNELMEQAMLETGDIALHFGTTEVPVQEAPETLPEENTSEGNSPEEAENSGDAPAEATGEPGRSGNVALPILVAAAALIVMLSAAAVIVSRKKRKSGV